MLIFSLATSPLYPHNFSYDSAFFRFIGAEILKGKTPYIDVWDHKGPILFFIQAIGAIGGTQNKGTNVLFLLQLFSIYVSTFFMYKIFREVTNNSHGRRKFFVILISVLSIFSFTIESGNLTEEWCMPMTCCSFYLMIKYAANASERIKHSRFSAYIHGICFGLIALIRINNALPICAGLMIIGIYLMYKNQWRNLISNILFGLLGIISVGIPVFVWYYLRGALSDMIYAAFTFNLNYTHIRSYIPYTGEPFVTRYLPAAAAVLIFIIHLLRIRKFCLIDLIVAAILTVSVWMVSDTNIYLHYFTVFVPVLFLVLIRCSDRIQIAETIILIALCVWFGWKNIQRIPDLLSLHRQPQMFTAAEQIPEEERNSVIAVNMPAELYLNYDLEPVSRFVANQHVHFAIDPEMKTEFMDTLRTRQPVWILADCRGETKIPEVQELIDQNYEPRFDQSDICYYRLKIPGQN